MPLQALQIFKVRGFEASVSQAETLGCVVCLAPQMFLLAYPHTNVGSPGPPATASPAQSASHCLALRCLCLAAHLRLSF